MRKLIISALFAGAALGSAAGHAAPIVTSSLYEPMVVAGTGTDIVLSGLAAASQTTIIGAGYSVSFSNVARNEGIVRNDLAGAHAAPVAGESGGRPTYLIGDYGSAQTTDLAASGDYLSTGSNGRVGVGGAAITISFRRAESAFALLWGSIDAGNQLDFYDDGVLQASVTGLEAQRATAGFGFNGDQGLGGSAYVLINDLTFDTVVASSSTPSFEFTAVAGSTSPISAVPEPGSLALLGASLFGFTTFRRRC